MLNELSANSSGAEDTGVGTYEFDVLSNGFKQRGTNGQMNTSSATYVYAAFASNPFGGSGAAPATAR
jgi:hypothetical protein